MNSNNNESGTKGWALGFGLLAGIAVGYYLNSNEGRAARRKAQVQFDEYGNQISTKATELSEQAKVKSQEYLETAKAKSQEYADTAKVKSQEYLDTAKTKLAEGKVWANETAANVKSTVTDKAQSVKSGATDQANSVADSFKKGMDKAKNKIDDKSEKIDEIVKA